MLGWWRSPSPPSRYGARRHSSWWGSWARRRLRLLGRSPDLRRLSRPGGGAGSRREAGRRPVLDPFAVLPDVGVAQRGEAVRDGFAIATRDVGAVGHDRG